MRDGGLELGSVLSLSLGLSPISLPFVVTCTSHIHAYLVIVVKGSIISGDQSQRSGMSNGLHEPECSNLRHPPPGQSVPGSVGVGVC